jgi:hypothetical protein
VCLASVANLHCLVVVLDGERFLCFGKMPIGRGLNEREAEWKVPPDLWAALTQVVPSDLEIQNEATSVSIG